MAQRGPIGRLIDRVLDAFGGGRQSGPARFDPRWNATLHRDYAHWSLLDSDEMARMEMLTARFMNSVDWEAANKFELTEDMQVVIAAQASMLLLGLDLDGYDDVTSVIVHPHDVVVRGARSAGGNVMTSAPRRLAGQAQYQGPVLLSWSAARRGARFPQRGQNVVYHEFAHRLDMLSGFTNGTPPLGSDDAVAKWTDVFTDSFDRVRNEGSPVLRPYAGTNTAEFFAVATEAFFATPHELRAVEPALMDELISFYGQDPSHRFPPPDVGNENEPESSPDG